MRKSRSRRPEGGVLCPVRGEIFKYYEIFKKSLSGGIGKNLHNLEYSTTTKVRTAPTSFS